MTQHFLPLQVQSYRQLERVQSAESVSLAKLDDGTY